MLVVPPRVSAYARSAARGPPHVELHGVRVRVNLDDPYLGAVLAEVLVERDQAGFVRLDEVTQLWDTPNRGALGHDHQGHRRVAGQADGDRTDHAVHGL